ncbi:MAG: DUF2844 domain-containing protein [Thiomonas sp.]|jgi:hypothetical protein
MAEPVHIMQKNRWIALGAVVALAAPLAWASFGPSSFHRPRRADAADPPTMAAQVVSRSLPTDIDIRETTGPRGIAVREYIAPNGALFAMTWAGAQHVEASEVVAGFFPRPPTGDAPAATAAPVVVRSVRQPWGSEGVAYVPARMPLDFDVNALAP